MRIDGLIGATSAQNTPADPKLRQAAEGFEQSLLAILAQQLQQTASSQDGDDSDDGTGAGALGAYGSMLPDTLAGALERAGGLGIADEVERGVEDRS